MMPAFLTVLLWSASTTLANRSVRLVGTAAANLGRLSLAGLLLALWAHLFGQGLGGVSFGYFVISGCIGFGLGDIALFSSLSRLGPRLTTLLCHCLAAPIAALVEWSWLGTRLTTVQIAWGVVILVGVAIALAPKEHEHIERKRLIAGVIFGIVSALGQALGAVCSRKAYLLAAAANQHIDGGTAAYQRAIGGLAIIIAYFVIRTLHERRTETTVPRHWGRGWPWIVAHALAGPTLGVSCFQWALATTPSGIVMPIVATTPLAVIPFAYFMEHDRPTLRSLIGGVIAVAGVVALTLVK